jgi:uncharacterized protein (TIGR02145 family)
MLLFLVLSALSLTVSAQDNPCGVEGVVIQASNFEYAPASVDIEVGQTVVWVNMGGTHDVNASMSSLTGEMYDNPETFNLPAVSGNSDGVCIGSHTFTVEGTYDYDCSIGNHAANGMVAAVIVNPAMQSNTVLDIIVNSPDHTVLEAAVTAVGLVGALSDGGTLTVFAPTDDAFTALLAALGITVEELLAFPGLIDILLYHVVGAQALSTDLSDGQQITTLLEDNVLVTINPDGIFINQSQVTVADLIADNGVVHVIDAVLLPEPVATTTVADIIVESDVHTMLEDALIATDLIGVLSGEGPFTVFAPTDDAFDALPAGTLEALLNDMDFLTDILVHHLAGGFVLSSDFSDGQEITTLLGVDVQVTITGDGVFINQAQVIVADLIADNGVVHVIDAVLMPELTGCTEISACNFEPDAVVEDNDLCVFPGCQDSDALNFDSEAGCAGECIYLTYECVSIGDEAWYNESVGLYPAMQQATHGVPWSGEWVFNVPASLIEPVSGVAYAVHHIEWSSVDGLPAWVENADYSLGELYAFSQHCIAAEGTPSEQAMHTISASGEAFISIFGQPFSIGEQTYSATISVLENPDPILGCTYGNAMNYVAYADTDDGTCSYPGCMDSTAGNYNPYATEDDGSCGEPCSTSGDSSCPTDITGDGFVNVSDLLELLSDFGAECIIEITEWTCGDPMNYHGYDYATVQIGEQCWFAENLQTELYSNADSIPGDLDYNEWNAAGGGTGAQAIKMNDASNLADYGRLYNWHAVDDSRGLCPSGWHVPTDGEFMTLEMELGMSESELNLPGLRGTDQGTQMKSSPENSPSWDGTNTSGFSGLEGGKRSDEGGFATDNCYFWSASFQSEYGGAVFRSLVDADGFDFCNQPGYPCTGVNRSWSDSVYGLSVRCVRD